MILGGNSDASAPLGDALRVGNRVGRMQRQRWAAADRDDQPHITTLSEPSVEVESQSRVSGPITFIDFYAEWCAVCKQTAPAVGRLRKEFKDEVIFVSYDVDAPASRDIVRQYRVVGVPTFVILDGKQEVISRFSGGVGYADMKQKLERYTGKR